MRPYPSTLIALALLTACSSGPSTPTARVSDGTSPTPTAAASRTPDATAAAPSSTARAASPGTPSASPRAIPAAQGDVDGDGEPDEITYEGGTAVVVLSGGGTVRASTDADIEADDPVTSGVEDLDRDGRAEVFVQVGRGASTGFLLVLRYDGTRLAPLTMNSRPRLLAFGGSATHGDGFSCTDTGRLIVRSAASDDGQAYALSTVTYRVRGSVLAETARTTTTANGMDDPAVAAAYVVDCRSVGEGG